MLLQVLLVVVVHLLKTQDLLVVLAAALKNWVGLVLEIHLAHLHHKVMLAVLRLMVLQQLRLVAVVAVQVQ